MLRLPPGICKRPSLTFGEWCGVHPGAAAPALLSAEAASVSRTADAPMPPMADNPWPGQGYGKGDVRFSGLSAWRAWGGDPCSLRC